MSTPSHSGQPGFAPAGPPNQFGQPGRPAPQGPAFAQPGQPTAAPPQNPSYAPQPGQPMPAPGFAAPQGPQNPAFAQPNQPFVPHQQGFAPQPQAFGPPPGFAPQNPGLDPFPAAKASFGAALHSEWTKIRSVRSTFWTLLVTMVVTIGLGALFAFGAVQHVEAGDRSASDWPAHAMSGLFLGQLVIVVFGALAITAEYSTGMIRTSLTSQPRRAVLFWAKTLIVALVSLAVGLICSFVSFFIASAVYSGHDVHVSLSDGDTLRAVCGGGLYLAVSALLAYGLGALLRHTAGAITAAVGLLFVVWILVNFLPGTWRTDIGKWVPFNAGLQIITTKPQDDMFSPWTGFAVFTAYAAIAVIGGAIVMRNKDA